MVYNQQMQDAYAATRRTPQYAPEPTAPPERDPLEDLKELAELHRSGFLTDDEFVTAKAKVLSSGDDEPA